MIPVLSSSPNFTVSQRNSGEFQSSQLMLSGASVSNSNVMLHTSKNSKVIVGGSNTDPLTLLVHQGKLVFTYSKASILPEMTVEEREKMVLPEIRTNEFLDLITAAKWIKEARVKYQPEKIPRKRLPLIGCNLLYAEYINKIITKLLIQGFSLDTTLSLVEKKRFAIQNTFFNVINTAAQQWSELARAHWSEIEQPTKEEIKNHDNLLARINNTKSFPFNFFKIKTILFFLNHFCIENNIETQKEVLINLICFKMRIDYKELMILLKEIKSDKINAIFTQEEKKNLHHIASLHDLAEHKRFDKVPLTVELDVEQATSEPVSKRARLDLDTNQADFDCFTLDDISYITMDAAHELISQAVTQLPTTIKNDFFVKLTTKLIKQGIGSDEIKKHLTLYGKSIYKTLEEVAKVELSQIATKLNMSISDLSCFDMLAYYRVTTMLNLLLEGESVQHICKLMALSQRDYEAYLKNTSSLIPLLSENQKNMLSQTVAQFEDQAAPAPRLQFETPLSVPPLRVDACRAEELPNTGSRPFLDSLESDSNADLDRFDTHLPHEIQLDEQQSNFEQLDFLSLETVSSPFDAEECINLDLPTLDQCDSVGFINFLDFLESDSNVDFDQLSELLSDS